MFRKVVSAAAACALLAACSSSSSAGSGNVGGGPSGGAANPVDLAKKIPLCQLPPGASVGDRPLPGVRSVDCEIPPPDDPSSSATEQVTVYTFDTNADRDDELRIQGSSTDDTKVISGDRFLITVIGVLNFNGGTDFYIPADAIADDVNGTVQ